MRWLAVPFWLLIWPVFSQSGFPDYVIDRINHSVVAPDTDPLGDVRVYELPDSAVSKVLLDIDRQLLFEGKQYFDERLRNRRKVSELIEQYHSPKEHTPQQEQREYAYSDSLELVYPELTYTRFDLLSDEEMHFVADTPDSAAFWAQPLLPWSQHIKPSHWYLFGIHTGGALHGVSYVWNIVIHVEHDGAIGEWMETKRTYSAPNRLKRL